MFIFLSILCKTGTENLDKLSLPTAPSHVFLETMNCHVTQVENFGGPFSAFFYYDYQRRVQ